METDRLGLCPLVNYGIYCLSLLLLPGLAGLPFSFSTQVFVTLANSLLKKSLYIVPPIHQIVLCRENLVKMTLFYNFVLLLIKGYRKLEYGILWLFRPFVVKFLINFLKGCGIEINGPEPWDIQVKDPACFLRFANEGQLGFGESYMDEQWDSRNLVETICKLSENREKIFRLIYHPWNRFLNYMVVGYFNLQTLNKASQVADEHYDLGNDLFESFLDPNMIYACGYWKNAKNLEQAQLDKLELIAQKLCLSPGMTVLDIGCGWGGLCAYLAEKHGVIPTGITISTQQVVYAQKRYAHLAMNVQLMDYRLMEGEFDRIVCIEMIEHVGHYNYDTFFKKVHKLLKKDGIFVLQTTGRAHYDLPGVDLWTTKYIFPNGYLPYYKDIGDAIEKRFIIEDWANFGHDYSLTLAAWWENFDKNWPTVKEKYGARFYRMWKYYLQSCQAYFATRQLQLWQIVLSKEGIRRGY